MEYRFNKKNIVTLSVHDLEDLVYTASYKSAKRAEEQLFGGLMPFFSRLFDENEKLLDELEYVKTLLKMENETIEETQPKQLNNETVEAIKNAPKAIFDKEIIKKLEGALKTNGLDIVKPNISVPQFEIPPMKGQE